MPISIFRAGESISAGNIVAVTNNSVLKKACANDPETFKAIGVAITSGNTGDAVKVIVDDQVHTFSGLTPGSYLYLSVTPGLYTTTFSSLASGVSTSLLGSTNLAPFARAISASGVALQTPSAVVADISSETITLENTPNTNIFNFLTEYGYGVVKESGISSYTPSDPNAIAYITAVETADGQELEPNVKRAIDNFVLGCKADGIWSAIKASCILAGARTLNGALVPLAGTAPTNNNFVSGDYDRKTGLTSGGNTKYLDSNRKNNDDPQNNSHVATWVSTNGTGSIICSGDNLAAGRNSIDDTGTVGRFDCRSFAAYTHSSRINANSLAGASRSSSASFVVRVNGLSVGVTRTSAAPDAVNTLVSARSNAGVAQSFYTGRLAFYSIGESLDLDKLDARVTTLINAFATAIP